MLFFSVAILPILLFSCHDSGRQAEEQLAKEIFAVHDAVMPKNADIVRMQKKLKKLDKQEKNLPPDAVADILEAIHRLEAAYDSMMLWMGDFKAPAKLRSSKSHEEIMVYLETEMAEIRAVETAMLSSLENGAQVLEKWDKK
ncbi:MAG: hypothetical protein RLY31_514 [Bacteroidota bacterium]|jgi:hypothetical protein